ncbi:MAG TPA: MBL fold metallo-hydrolase [Acidimicrobiales bacterium]|nr:MBL fold metallo-hydrolase [Acidimicrobiales bacterium]
MTLTVLGCSGSYPTASSAASGYLVRCGDDSVWLDAGSGTLANLQRHQALARITAIVLTHAHADHWSDVEGYAVAAQYYLKLPPVPVYAPESVAAHLRDSPVLDWRTVGDGQRVTAGGMDIFFSRTEHPVETVAVRIDGGGRSLGYSADTGPGWSLGALGPGLHTALCEATVLSKDEGDHGHLSARQAGAMARAAGVERLVTTHRAPTVDAAESLAEATVAFGSSVEAAVDHAVYLV